MVEILASHVLGVELAVNGQKVTLTERRYRAHLAMRTLVRTMPCHDKNPCKNDVHTAVLTVEQEGTECEWGGGDVHASLTSASQEPHSHHGSQFIYTKWPRRFRFECGWGVCVHVVGRRCTYRMHSIATGSKHDARERRDRTPQAPPPVGRYAGRPRIHARIMRLSGACH